MLKGTNYKKLKSYQFFFEGNVKGLEQSERDVLKAHRVLIADNLQERRVVEQLFAEGILNLTDREEINAETSRFGRCCLLLDKLPRKGPNAFQSFLQALRLSGQGFLADKLSGMKHKLTVNSWLKITSK